MYYRRTHEIYDERLCIKGERKKFMMKDYVLKENARNFQKRK